MIKRHSKIVKKDFTVAKNFCYFGDWKHINPELFICAEEQGYSLKFGNKTYFDLLVVMDLCEIQRGEDKKMGVKKIK